MRGDIMVKRIMSTDESLNKLNKILQMAGEAANSGDIIRRIGAVALYAGMVDFYTIQAARLIEQIILKSQITAGEKPKFKPNSDSYFYDNRKDTREILDGIEKIIPFGAGSPGSATDAEKANALIEELIAKISRFLNYRNAVLHHSCSPKMTLEELSVICNKAILSFKDIERSHTAFFNVVQPYRFSGRELSHFYGPK
jgi:hypothetical protein